LPSSIIKKILKKTHSGFTLVEILIVMTIVSSLTTGAIVSINPTGVIDRGQDSKRKVEINRVKTYLEEYFNDLGCYPTQVPFGQSWLYGPLPQDPKYPTDNYVYSSDGTCSKWYAIFYHLQAYRGPTAACNLPSNCLPVNYQPVWGCATIGNVDCSVISSLVLPLKILPNNFIAVANIQSTAPNTTPTASAAINFPTSIPTTIIPTGTNTVVILPSTAPTTPTPTVGFGITAPPPATDDSVFKQASDGSWCYDSDGNDRAGQTKEYALPGFCMDRTGMYQDYCSSGVARSYYCSGTWNGTFSNYHCANGGYTCGNHVGIICSNGACTDSPLPTPIITIPPATKTLIGYDGTYCYDSDGSASTSIAGTCQDATGLYKDYCIGVDTVDYGCSGRWNGVGYGYVKCNAGVFGTVRCSNGATSGVGSTGSGSTGP